MKKWTSFLLILLLCLTLTACGGEVGESSIPPANSSTTTTAIITTTTAESATHIATTLTTTDSVTTTQTTSASISQTQPTTTKVPQSGSTPLLYKVTDGKGHTIWLFGSIHVGRDSMYPLPAYVIDAFTGAEALAVECDIVAFEQDMAAQMEALTPLIYTDGTTISAKLPAEVYQSAVAILKENQLYNAALDYYCPSMWSSMIDSALILKMDMDAEKGVDRCLLNMAKTQKKPILEIESAKQQYSMLGGFSQPLQQILLQSSIE